MLSNNEADDFMRMSSNCLLTLDLNSLSGYADVVSAFFRHVLKPYYVTNFVKDYTSTKVKRHHHHFRAQKHMAVLLFAQFFYPFGRLSQAAMLCSGLKTRVNQHL